MSNELEPIFKLFPTLAPIESLHELCLISAAFDGDGE
jgi:hypothetical protein